MPTKTTNLLALDVGGRRIGVAFASSIARLARPLTVLANDGAIWDELSRLISSEQVGVVVIGLPRSLKGEDTAQTKVAREFGARLAHKFAVPVVYQDEALTSRQAEAELRTRGKHYEKGDIDALAATYILEDYLSRAGSIGSMEQQT